MNAFRTLVDIAGFPGLQNKTHLRSIDTYMSDQARTFRILLLGSIRVHYNKSTKYRRYLVRSSAVTRFQRDTLMPANHTELEKRLWEAADELRANSKLKSSEYSPQSPCLDLSSCGTRITSSRKRKIASKSTGRRSIRRRRTTKRRVCCTCRKRHLLHVAQSARRCRYRPKRSTMR